MNLAIIGSGYVGLVSAVCFSENGNKVICVDKDERKIARLNNGDPIIFEPGLATLLKKNINSNRISFTTNISDAVKSSDIIFIAVGTPSNEDGSADLSNVLSVAKDISKSLNNYKIIVNKSTVPVGSSTEVEKIIKKEQSSKIKFDVVSNPEFLKEGDALSDFMRPDRIIIGTNSTKVQNILKKLYQPFVRNNHPIIFMDPVSAELTKYASNAMLAARISFMNEMSLLCEKVGANIDMVREGIGSDQRIGPSFLYPGPGYGGSCFPKDIRAILNTGKKNNIKLNVIEAVELANINQKSIPAKKILDYYKNDIKEKKIAVLGLSFKANTDDIRESPSIISINVLLENKAIIKAHDPEAIKNAKKHYKNIKGITFSNTIEQTIENVEVILIMTEWREYSALEDIISKSESCKLVMDARNMYKKSSLTNKKIKYLSIGR